MSLADIVVLALQLVSLALIARAILSWFPIGFESPVRPVVDMVDRITNPIIMPVRRMLPPMGGFDISTMLVIFGIQLLLIPLVRAAL